MPQNIAVQVPADKTRWALCGVHEGKFFKADIPSNHVRQIVDMMKDNEIRPFQSDYSRKSWLEYEQPAQWFFAGVYRQRLRVYHLKYPLEEVIQRMLNRFGIRVREVSDLNKIEGDDKVWFQCEKAILRFPIKMTDKKRRLVCQR